MIESLLDRWRRLIGVRDHAQPAAAAPAAAPETIAIDMAATLSRQFPDEYPLASAAADRVLAVVRGADLSPLARRSPALQGYDWTAYLRCSVARVVRVQQALRRHVAPGARVLDYGSYFGNFALACAASGFAVEAADSYSGYGDALAPCVRLQQASGVVVHDFVTEGYDLGGGAGFDAVICAGVIEHMPHTPRPLLETLNRLLVPGGILILDTPNLAYLYRRLALLEGQSIFPAIAQQFHTELPFEGHHREYTVAEVEWMLSAIGHELLSLEVFNYSVFGQMQLSGDHVAYFRAMEHDPSLREIIIAVSRRPTG